MIVGKWKVKRHYRGTWNGYSSTDVQGSKYVDALWEFFSDGTYTDSSDGCTHRWQLTDDTTQGEPYYGGIEFDGED